MFDKNPDRAMIFFSMAITDIALLLILLIGLLRLRRRGGRTFGLNNLLWKQVWWQFSVTVALSLQVADMLPFCKGLIWAIVATAAEVPPAVSPDICAPLLFVYRRHVPGVCCFEFEWYFSPQSTGDEFR